ncbi:PilZ domain-containing protein [Candidatus Venteria ishoeyi]|uniref:PilZ domain protein n=1 Tax=Candidatus Venteria ishoeyi TaxID=1899563 RepID=A0A1H6FIG6_9GAMM|nr:PilZ domain-containing protein [Candidatus Venteria ishoeyi]SEH08845.1 PilZ domain protein [Candidatus Venteria ishoeyi]
MQEHRKFYRHPTEIPVEISKVSDAEENTVLYPFIKDVSEGGLAFICTIPWPVGSIIKIRLPLIKPPFEAIGTVAWSRRRGSYYDVGVAFDNKHDVFQGRMIEQMCQIEIYRQKLAGEGRDITTDEAAMEWISRYAASFDKKAIQAKAPVS